MSINILGKKDVFLQGSAILFVGNMVGNVCNYFFQFFMARHLTTEDFGAMNSLLSLLMISSVPALSIMLVASKFVSNFKANGELEKVRPFQKKLFKPVSILGGVVFLVLACASPLIRDFLHLDSVIPVILVVATLYVSFLIPVNLGTLQGLQRFLPLGAARGLAGFLKICIGAAFVLAGFALNGAIGGMLVGGVIVLAMTSFFLRTLPETEGVINDLGIGYKKIRSFTVPVLLNALGIMLLTNMDMILVKHYFPAEAAGNYAKVAVLGKMVFYLPGIIVMAMFPVISEKFALKQEVYKTFFKALSICFLLSSSGMIILWIFPDLMLTILFGSTFEGAGTLLFGFCLAMIFMSLINISTHFCLAMENKVFLFFLYFSAFFELLLMIYFHDSIKVIVFNIVLSLFICMILIKSSIIIYNKGMYNKAY